MKAEKKLGIMLLLIAVFFCFFRPRKTVRIHAQEVSVQSAYENFTRNYRNYQTFIDPLKTSRSKYQSYGTVTSQAEYMEASKKLLTAENDALASFALFLKLALKQATNILFYRENMLYIQLDDEISFLDNFKQRTVGFSSLEETASGWKEFKSHYEKISLIALEINAMLEINYVKQIYDTLKVDQAKMEAYLADKDQSSTSAQAAREKFQNLNRSFDYVLDSLNKADNMQKNFTIQSMSQSYNAIHGLIGEALINLKKIIFGYQNIMDSLG